MKKIIFILFVTAVAVLSADSLKNSVEFSFEKGSSWSHVIKAGFIKIKSSPQIAIWSETVDGKFIETVYVSKTAAKWYRKGSSDRLDALPVWLSREDGSIDAVSGATVEAAGSLHRDIKRDSGKIMVFVEVNNSFDYNDYYTEKGENGTVKSGVNGQPSLIYSAEIDMSQKKKYRLILKGHGSIGKKSSVVDTDMSRITTANNIADAVYVTVK